MNRNAIIFFTAIFLLSGCGQQTRVISVEENVEENPGADAATTTISTSSVATIKKTATSTDSAVEGRVSTTVKQVTVPARLELPVAFAQQAPFANWDEEHEETCEEASLIMAAKYFKGQPLSETIMEDELQKMLKWNDDNGYKLDYTAAETAKVAQDYFGLSARISDDVSVDAIKYELSKGNLVIVPAAGRELKNPNFKRPGPIYHMLLIKGYNDSEFITNDPGTRKGNSYRYPYQQLLEAVHDWSHELAEGGMTDAEIAQQPRGMIIIEKI